MNTRKMFKFKPKTKAIDKLLSARLALKDILPLIYPLSTRFTWVRNDSVPTSAVDVHANFYYNEQFIDGFDNIEEVVTVVAHEAMHIVQKYHSRIPSMPDINTETSGFIFNLAADRVINSLLWEHSPVFRDNKVMELMGVNAALVKEINTHYRYTEAVFLEMIKALNKSRQRNKQGQCNGQGNGQGNQQNSQGNQQNSQGNQQNSQSSNQGQGGKQKQDDADSIQQIINDISDGLSPGELKNSLKKSVNKCQAHKHNGDGKESEDNDDHFDEWKLVVQAGKELQKSRGNANSSIMQKLLNSLFASKISWKDILMQHLDKVFGFNEYNYTKFARRTITDEIFMPGNDPPLGAVGVAIDMSGSMSEEERNASLAETMAICKSYVSSIVVIMHTYDVYFVGEIKRPEEVKNLPWATGGTSHEHVFQVIENEHPKYKIDVESPIQLLICFTDMETVFPSKEPSIPVIWVNTRNNDGNAPFGTVINYKI